MKDRLATTLRLMMGAIYLISGVNWWFKMITPYPSISDFATSPPPPDMVGAMIETGVFFHIVKATELLTGIALLTNRFVPMMLVMVLPITFSIFIVDAFFIAHPRGIMMGTGSMLMNLCLLLVFIGHYRGVLTVTAIPDRTGDAAPVAEDSTVAPLIARLLRPVMPPLLWLSIAFGVAMLASIGWLMIQYAQNPLPLSALHPPPPAT